MWYGDGVLRVAKYVNDINKRVKINKTQVKVVLLEEIRGLGKKYEVKDVANGHARNFLFPNKLAKPATASALKESEQLTSRLQKNEAENKKRLEELAGKINELKLEFEVKTDETGAVFGSVTKEMILRALRKHNLVRKERVDVTLNRPLKELGEYKLRIDLKKGIEADLVVILRPQP